MGVRSMSFGTDYMGLSLKNVSLTMTLSKRKVYEGFGEMLFTHFGVSGPLVLSASTFYREGADCRLAIDLKPALSEEQLDKRLLREFDANHMKQFKNALSELFPNRLIPVMIELSGISPEKKVHEITKAERANFVKIIKHLELTVTGTRGFAEAIITRGGGSIFTFEIKGGKEAAYKFIDSLKIFSILANVADVKSLVIHPASTTHSQLSEEELLDQDIRPGTIRLSIGTEHVDDIIDDLTQAFDAVK